ncbi:MAG: glycogen/starch synthase, ADP-glucose type [Candidatus Peregrinibacteria bacterium Gr01-1014_25]|nr:MAG: glycogen/starch synthase, ADP-glucose type [Candidatus Peregrinibacteria bacterium Gr01-1014_25]
MPIDEDEVLHPPIVQSTYHILHTRFLNISPLLRGAVWEYNIWNTHMHPMRSPSPSPASDTALDYPYTAKTLDMKLQNKAALQEELGWPVEPKRMLLCLPDGMTETLGGALLMELLPGLATLPVELVILGKGSAQYGNVLTQLAGKHRHRIAILPAQESAQTRLLAAADASLFLTDAGDLPALPLALAYGAVPIALATRSLDDYNPNQESGNAFVFQTPTVWHAFAAAVRALETYRFPFDWRTIQRHCMQEE